MDGYPCTCGGENCNCFRCDGTGIVEKSLPAIGRPHRNFAQAVHEVAAKQTRVINNPPENRIERNKGRYSRWSLVPKEFPTAPRTSNIIPKKLKIALKEWLGSPQEKCAICGVEVKNMEKHHRKTHT